MKLINNNLVKFSAYAIALSATAYAATPAVLNPGEFAVNASDLSIAVSSIDLGQMATVSTNRGQLNSAGLNDNGNGNGPDSAFNDGLIGDATFGGGDNGAVNGSNGNANGGTDPLSITLDFGSIQSFGVVNVFSSAAPNGSERVNQIFQVLGTNDLDGALTELTGGIIIDTISGTGPDLGTDQFGVSSIDLDGAEFQFLVFATEFIDNAGGGEGTIFHEIDVFAVPEPSSTALLGLGALGLLARRRR